MQTGSALEYFPCPLLTVLITGLHRIDSRTERREMDPNHTGPITEDCHDRSCNVARSIIVFDYKSGSDLFDRCAAAAASTDLRFQGNSFSLTALMSRRSTAGSLWESALP